MTMYEIRIHSRGGQGGVTAARLLALAAIHDGKYATACPFYGAERRGAPIVSFVRIDDKPIKIYSQIKKPDMIVVLDASVMDVVDVLQGLKKGGRVFINSAGKREFPGYITSHVDLTGIALRENLVVAGKSYPEYTGSRCTCKNGDHLGRFSKKINPRDVQR